MVAFVLAFDRNRHLFATLRIGMATFRAWIETLQNIKLHVELQVRGLRFEVCNGVAGHAGEDNVVAARNRVSNVQASSHLALASI